MTMLNLLIINPNSSSSITQAIASSLSPVCPPGVSVTFWNPSTGPPGIKDFQTGIESTEACLLELVGTPTSPPTHPLGRYDGVLVCCFSEHPLIDRLANHFEKIGANTISLGIFQAGITAALLLTTKKFGIIATGTGRKENHYVGVGKFLGVDSNNCPRFVGSMTTGLQVVELQDKNLSEKVENGIKDTTKVLVESGAEVIVLGCAGMCGMDPWIHQVAKGMGKRIRIVDSPRVGMQMLVALLRAR